MPFALTNLAASIWRDYETDGVPASGRYSPRKSQIRTWGTELQNYLNGTTALDQINVTGGNIGGATTFEDLDDPIPLASGGTGANSAAAALTALGITVSAASINDLVSGGAIPTGLIGMWSDLIGTIPTGWQACDGTNGTPDMRNLTVMGAGDTYGVGTTGGAATVTLTEAQLPAHTHGDGTLAAASGGAHTHTGSTGAGGSHSHTIETIRASGGGAPRQGIDETSSVGESAVDSFTTNTVGNHTHSVTVDSGGTHTHDVTGATASTGSGEAHNNLPPYRALFFIMKMAA